MTLVLGLVKASAVLDNTYHFDERFSLRNVSAVVVDRTLRPANAFYPSLSYLPQAALLLASHGLHRATGIGAFAVFDADAADGWSSTAYFLCRLLTVVYGTVSVWLLFRVGRRLFDERTGLLAALFLAGTPGLLLASTLFKPDVLVLLLTLLTFAWAWEAAQAPAGRSFARAGVGVGLAVAAKYTGVAGALPVAAAALAGARSGRRAVAWLGLAALASLATFALLNPYLAVVVRFLPRLWTIYESKGEAAGGSRWAVVASEAGYLQRHHGWAVGLLAAAGAAALLHAAVRRTTGRRERLAAVLLLTAVLGYTALYAASTTLFKGQNYLPILPFTSLLAAVAGVRGFDWARARAPALGRPAVAGGLCVLLAAAVLWRPAQRVYQDTVPTTWDLAEREIARLPALDRRFVYYERTGDPLRFPGTGPVTVPLARLGELTAAELDEGDAELFPQARLRGPEAAFYGERLRSGRVLPLAASPLRAWGPELRLVLHPWEERGAPAPLAVTAVGHHRFTARPEAGWPDCARVSLEIWLPVPRGSRPPRWAEVDERRLALYSDGRGRRVRHVTPRFVPRGDEELGIALEDRGQPPAVPEIALHCWAPFTG